MGEPAWDDIQGIVRFGHGRLNEARFLLLEVKSAELACNWLEHCPVTNAAKADPLPDFAMQVAFTSSGLLALGVESTVIEGFSDEFLAGMGSDKTRSRRLGDTGVNAPENWNWGVDKKLPQILLMLYANKGGLEAQKSRLLDDLFTSAFIIQQELHTEDLDGKEPFGFADGISQPVIDWSDKKIHNKDEHSQFSNLAAPGEVLLGYSNEYRMLTKRPLVDEGNTRHSDTLLRADDKAGKRDFGKNGSYLVFRQLEQDVPGFWQFLDKTVAGDESARNALAASMVGRHPDGSPLVAPAADPIAGISSESKRGKLNQFNYDNDEQGRQCPFGSHVRRSNPRTGDFPAGTTGLLQRIARIFGFGQQYAEDDLVASTRFHRLLRRGRAYGSVLEANDAIKPDAPQAERGLHFICLVANISRQFEFVQNAWIAGTKFSGLQNEADPLMGNRDPLINGGRTDVFTSPSASGPATVIHDLPRFVQVKGGAYFFLPGIRALRFIAASHRYNADTVGTGTGVSE